MSLAPPNDIVLEVSRAADPARAAAVADKLKALSAQGTASPAEFASALSASAPRPPVRVATAAPSRADKAQTKLESVILTEFVSEMLPRDAPSAFGGGYGGDMWRSMLAERVADQMASSGRLGIGQRLFANHALSSGAKLSSPEHVRGAAQAQAAQTSANALSAPSGADIENGAIEFARTAPL